MQPSENEPEPSAETLEDSKRSPVNLLLLHITMQRIQTLHWLTPEKKIPRLHTPQT